jgi:hypothetical protein
MISKYTNVKFQMSVSVCLKIYQFLFRDSVNMVFTNRIFYNVFRAISYEKKDFEVIFFDTNILKPLMSLMTYIWLQKTGTVRLKLTYFYNFFLV